MWFRAVQRSALCRSRRELSNAYFLAKFGFDTAENEPSGIREIRLQFQIPAGIGNSNREASLLYSAINVKTHTTNRCSEIMFRFLPNRPFDVWPKYPQDVCIAKNAWYGNKYESEYISWKHMFRRSKSACRSKQNTVFKPTANESQNINTEFWRS